MNDRYHYTECGLSDVWLMNGFEFTTTPYGEGVTIHDVDGLHQEIGRMLCRQVEPLTGSEVRFLRHELDLSQKTLAAFLGVTEVSLARWETGKTKIPGPAQRLLCSLYRETITGNAKVAETLERLSDLDAQMHRERYLARTEEHEWKVCA